MSVPTGEASGGASPEVFNDFEPLLVHEQRIAQLSTPSSEVMTAMRPLLLESAETAMQSCMSPHDRETMARTVEVYDWHFFGQFGEPLPPALTKQQTEPDNIERWKITFNPDQSIGQDCLAEGASRLQETLEVVNREVRRDIATREAETKEAIGDLITDSPAYQLAQSFAAPLPAQPAQRPLTLAERNSREALIDNTYRLDATTRHTQLGRMAHREKLALGDMTVADSMPRQQLPAIERARAYFKRELVGAYDAALVSADLPIISTYTSRRTSLLIAEEDHEGVITFHDLDDAILDAAQNICDVHNPASTPASLHVEKLFLGKFIPLLLQEERQYTYEQIVSKAVELASAEALEQVRGAGSLTHNVFMPGNLVYAVRQPNARLRPYEEGEQSDQVGQEMHKHRSATEVTVRTRAEIEAQERTIVGTVIKPDGSNRHERLMQLQPIRAVLPAHTGREQLELDLASSVFEDNDVYIPGYRLVSREGSRFGFVHDEAGDPYESKPIILPRQNMEDLAAQYETIQLDVLASELRAGNIRTAQELAEAIRTHSVYPMPEETRQKHETGNELVSASLKQTFVQFDAVVLWGKLHVQCSGAAQFLRLSFEELFGPGSASVIDGFVLGQDRNITRSGHAQVLLAHNGQAAILDATAEDGRRPAQRRWPRLFGRRRPGYRPDAAQQPTAPEIDLTPDMHIDDVERQLQIGLAALRHTVEEQLMNITATSRREDLYSRVNRMPPADPMHKMLTLVAQADRMPDALERVAADRRYFQRYSDADPAVLRKHRLHEYDQHTLELFAQNAERMGGFILRSAALAMVASVDSPQQPARQ